MHRAIQWLALAAITGAGPLGCKSAPTAAPTGPSVAAAPAPGSGVTPADALPESAPELAGLAFLSGHWACVNPNKSVNREHWMSPRGRSMPAVFEQLRRDGTVAFYEVSAIVAEADGSVMLYHRSLHPRLAIDDRRADADLFRLKSIDAAAGKAVFEPATGSSAGGILTMTYRADGPNRLVQELAFKPDSKDKNFSTTYQREP